MSKGGLFEREISKELSVWWSRKGDDDLFWRTHGSGARATTRFKKGKKTKGQYGDIGAVDNRGKTFCKVTVVSLKRGYQKTTIGDLMDAAENNAEPQFCKWIREVIICQRQAETLGWMLIVRRNRRQPFVFMNWALKIALVNSGARDFDKVTPQISCQANVWRKIPPKKKWNRMTSRQKIRWHLRNRTVMFGCLWRDFIELVDREHFVVASKRMD